MVCINDEVSSWAKEKSKLNAKAKKEKLNQLIRAYDHKWSTGQISEKVQIELNSYVDQIETLIEERTKSATFRSRAQYAKDYEKGSKFFFSLERSNYNKKIITKLLDVQGKEITDQDKILAMQKQYYAELYKKNPNVSFTLVNDPHFLVLDEDERNTIEKEFTLQEFDEAVKQLKRNKCCGSDGMSAEYYQFFWSKLCPIYYEAIRYAHQTGKLHLTARRGVIALIPKKKDLRYLKHWRPLTMLSTKYKILATAIANRLKRVYP